MYYVYILQSKKLKKFYIGCTSKIEVRMEFHKNPETRKFTAKADDWILFHQLEYEDKKQSLAVEVHIKKKKSKIYIQNLKKYPDIQEKLLVKYKS